MVACFGSPHGDDQAGWRLAAMLQRRADVPARVIVVHEATQLVEALGDCRRLILVDGCRSTGRVGTVHRLRWPDPRFAARHNHSTHGVSVFTALQLADQLGRMPPQVDLFGIEIGDSSPGSDVSLAVLQAVFQLEATIFDELQEVAHA